MNLPVTHLLFRNEVQGLEATLFHGRLLGRRYHGVGLIEPFELDVIEPAATSAMHEAEPLNPDFVGADMGAAEHHTGSLIEYSRGRQGMHAR